MQSLAYLWNRNQAELLKEMVDNQMESIIIKVASFGLSPQKHLGKTLAQNYEEFIKMQATHGLNVCGEGGEYQSLTLDCPIYK